MQKSIVFLSFVFLVSAFKYSPVGNSKSNTLATASESRPDGTARVSDATPASVAVASTKVTGPLRVVVSGGIMYGEIKTITADKVIFDTIDYGHEDENEPAHHNVEHTIQYGLVMNEKGEIGAPIVIFVEVEVEGGKFPCSPSISHDPNSKFCNHLVLETDEIFTKKLETDPNFRQQFGAMIGKTFEADVKNPYFKVVDVH